MGMEMKQMSWLMIGLIALGGFCLAGCANNGQSAVADHPQGAPNSTAAPTAAAVDDNPERAAVILLSDSAKGEDGFLQASETVQLPLEADLVVRSACDTAVGPVEGQEGIANLSKAFLLAGARTVISTLWSLNDDTALYLMREFYSQLAHGHDAAEALAAAKRKILKSFGQAKIVPYYWAGYTVEGFVPRSAA